jgi:hypothetical protein
MREFNPTPVRSTNRHIPILGVLTAALSIAFIAGVVVLV